mmetsp:Transcript_47291/g.94282  ORF Transcript_47291/g.94282 Transcript_47291/m.94282 type:complete len:86 (+) Transcript_47291:459-716(+)
MPTRDPDMPPPSPQPSPSPSPFPPLSASPLVQPSPSLQRTSKAGPSLRKLDINGALGTAELSEKEIHKLCPALEALDTRGRARKF